AVPVCETAAVIQPESLQARRGAADLNPPAYTKDWKNLIARARRLGAGLKGLHRCRDDSSRRRIECKCRSCWCRAWVYDGESAVRKLLRREELGKDQGGLTNAGRR